jgi:hypothetical protein
LVYIVNQAKGIGIGYISLKYFSPCVEISYIAIMINRIKMIVQKIISLKNKLIEPEELSFL